MRAGGAAQPARFGHLVGGGFSWAFWEQLQFEGGCMPGQLVCGM